MIRIVKMHFRKEGVEDFLRLFAKVQPRIKAFPGCTGLKLLKDIDTPEIFFTYSEWNSSENLEAYRKSDLFSETWAETKALFAEKAQAWSVDEFNV